jgi:hypothetical protein
MITERSASARITIVALHRWYSGCRFIFSQGRHDGEDDRVNGGERPRLGKEL